ncbi:TPA: transcriptional regulator [Kluyvera intermedia]|nr:transcriptional regulator [Kluyvera intermedia]
MLIAKFLNWEECSLSDYEIICSKFGYNCESSPEFLAFMLRNNAPLRFFSYTKKGKKLGGACVENGWLANDYKNKNRLIKTLPIPKSSVYIPLDFGLKNGLILPFKTKCLHSLQKKIIINSSYELLSKRKVAITKDILTDFSKKTISTREREVRNFIKSGGSFKPISEVSSDLFFDMYDELYFARRNTHVSDVDLNRKFFKEFHHRFKGDVMMMGEDPVAIQILISADSQAGFFVDYINIGYKQEKNGTSMGTVLMWKNLTAINSEAQSANKRLYYSYGFMSGEYKKRWCNPESIGRALI